MRWKWREATSKWLLGSYYDDTVRIILGNGRVSCITTKHIAFTHVGRPVSNELLQSSDLSLWVTQMSGIQLFWFYHSLAPYFQSLHILTQNAIEKL